MVNRWNTSLWLAGVILVYVVLGIGFVIRTPDWQNPDEPAHYNYVRQVAENGCCPLIEAGDWDSAYLDTLKIEEFHPSLLERIDTIQYEDHQAPLYYLVASALYQVSGGGLFVVRLFSLILGIGIIFFAYQTAREVFPSKPYLAVGVAAFVAWIPQHIAMLSAANNDAMAELWVAIGLWHTVRYLKKPSITLWDAVIMGVLGGLGALTKVNALFICGVFGLAILIRWWREKDRAIPQVIAQIIGFLLPFVVLAGVWWMRNISVYGMPDFLGLARHDEVVVGQLRAVDYIGQIGGLGTYLQNLISTTFRSFWGQLGWMAAPLPTWAYGLIGILLVYFGVGWALRVAQRPALSESSKAVWLILSISLIFTFLQYAYYNSEFVQFQGRYLFVGLVPMGIFIALGVEGWANKFFKRQPFLALVPFLSLVIINGYVIWRILPGLSY